MKLNLNRGIVFAVLSAMLSAMPTPYCKHVLGNMHPFLLIVILNFSVGFGVWLMGLALMRHQNIEHYEPFCYKRDTGWLLLSIVTGGIVASIFLMLALKQIPSSSTSLLSSFEGMFASILAWFLFKEPFDAWTAKGSLFITLGTVVLFSEGLHSSFSTFSTGGMAALLSFFFMAIDTNAAGKLAHMNPFHFIPMKCLIAALLNLIIIWAYVDLGPLDWPTILLAGLIGFIGWGIGYYFFFLALREVGAARTASLVAISPFMGVSLAIVFLHESITLAFIIALVCIAAGTVCLACSRSTGKYMLPADPLGGNTPHIIVPPSHDTDC